MIAGRNQEDAERKLKQMYHHCEIVRYGSHQQEMIKPGQKGVIHDTTSLLEDQESISA
jgi:hypothetical protein